MGGTPLSRPSLITAWLCSLPRTLWIIKQAFLTLHIRAPHKASLWHVCVFVCVQSLEDSSNQELDDLEDQVEELEGKVARLEKELAAAKDAASRCVRVGLPCADVMPANRLHVA